MTMIVEKTNSGNVQNHFEFHSSQVIPSKENFVVEKHDFYSKKSIPKKSLELPSIHLFEFKKSKSLLSRFLLFSK